MRIGRISEMDLSKFSTLNCDELVLFQVESEFESEDDELESFRIVDMPTLSDIETLSPNLKSIKGSVEIRNNPELENIDFLNDFEAPLYDVPYTPQFSVAHLREMIVIADNPKLDSCNLDYLCKTLELFPDSVRIENNGLGCTLDEVKKYCGLTSTNLISDNSTKFYPNPVGSTITWNSKKLFNRYSIFTATGQMVKTSKLDNIDKEIVVQDLVSGFYILRLESSDGFYVTTFVKT